MPKLSPFGSVHSRPIDEKTQYLEASILPSSEPRATRSPSPSPAPRSSNSNDILSLNADNIQTLRRATPSQPSTPINIKSPEQEGRDTDSDGWSPISPNFASSGDLFKDGTHSPWHPPTDNYSNAASNFLGSSLNVWDAFLADDGFLNAPTIPDLRARDYEMVERTSPPRHWPDRSLCPPISPAHTEISEASVVSSNWDTDRFLTAIGSPMCTPPFPTPMGSPNLLSRRPSHERGNIGNHELFKSCIEVSECARESGWRSATIYATLLIVNLACTTLLSGPIFAPWSLLIRTFIVLEFAIITGLTASAFDEHGALMPAQSDFDNECFWYCVEL
ncbi:hypothetical protein K490DRAFT_65696 [Saccharata proteae CBS 121410]|uniref:Uncharacterized protein n=1 Tax=Saccharata proteae CBS 121410 TaxID=1314787 RepID=A0A9P4HV38_9PEZI|nr:hypothetical protein K490DRAFT_65696 [Saccharata proteae CBS 121410]